MWGRKVSALGVPSALLPDLEEEIPCIPEAIGLPPKGLDHVVCAFDGAIRDVMLRMGDDALHPPSKHPPDLLEFRDLRSLDDGHELRKPLLVQYSDDVPVGTHHVRNVGDCETVPLQGVRDVLEEQPCHVVAFCLEGNHVALDPAADETWS